MSSYAPNVHDFDDPLCSYFKAIGGAQQQGQQAINQGQQLAGQGQAAIGQGQAAIGGAVGQGQAALGGIQSKSLIMHVKPGPNCLHSHRLSLAFIDSHRL